MKKLLLSLLMAFIFVAPARAWPIIDMNHTIDQTNFLVDDDCSGTLVAPDKVLTAAHCIVSHYNEVEKDVVDKGELQKKKFLVAAPGTVSQQIYTGPDVSSTKSYVYTVAAIDRKDDLALLQIQKLDNTPAPVSCTELMRGDTVFAVGNSFGILYSTVTKGIVSSTTRDYKLLQAAGDLGDTTDDGMHGFVQHSAVIAPGNSGGALYNDKGELVGVNVRAVMRLGGFGFAVPLDDVRKFLTDNGAVQACGGKSGS